MFTDTCSFVCLLIRVLDILTSFTKCSLMCPFISYERKRHLCNAFVLLLEQCRYPLDIYCNFRKRKTISMNVPHPNK